MFRVKCPICGGVLTVDERTRKVIEHLTREETERSPEERFDSIVSSLRKSRAERERRLAEAKRREAERQRHLEDLFKKAQRRVEDTPEDHRPAGPVWD